jgi:hypothetical protein
MLTRPYRRVVMLGDRYSFSCRSRAQYGTLWVASIIQASVKIRKTLQMEHVGLLLWSDLQTSLHGWRCTCFCTATRRKNCLLLDSKAGGLDDRMDHRAHLAGLQVLSCEHRMVRYVHGLESTWCHSHCLMECQQRGLLPANEPCVHDCVTLVIMTTCRDQTMIWYVLTKGIIFSCSTGYLKSCQFVSSTVGPQSYLRIPLLWSMFAKRPSGHTDVSNVVGRQTVRYPD